MLLGTSTLIKKKSQTKNIDFDKKKSQTTNTNFEAYLEWMKKVEFIFDCHHYFV